jgi:hypothetical protein
MDLDEARERVVVLERRCDELRAQVADLRQRLGRARPGTAAYGALAAQLEVFEEDLEAAEDDLKAALLERRRLRADLGGRRVAASAERVYWRPSAGHPPDRFYRPR